MAYSPPNAGRTTGEVITASIWNQDVANNMLAAVTSFQPLQLSFIFDGGGGVIAVNTKIYCPYKLPTFTISEWEIETDVTGSIQFDIWSDTYANYPPTVADTIVASDHPLLSAANHGSGTALTGWTTTIAKDNTLVANVDSCGTITKATLTLYGKRAL